MEMPPEETRREADEKMTEIYETLMAATKEWSSIFRSGGRAVVFVSLSGCYCMDASEDNYNVSEHPQYRRPSLELFSARTWGSLSKKVRETECDEYIATEVIINHRGLVRKTIERLMERVRYEVGADWEPDAWEQKLGQLTR